LRVFMAEEAIASTGLLQQGSLYARIYKIAMPEASDRDIDVITAQLKQQFPERIWNIRTRINAAPTLEVNIKRFLQFLTLVGLTALVVGGTGIAQAVTVYLDKKREVIAIFKTLGASGSFVIRIYLIQILMISLVAIMVGMGLAALVPALLKQILQQFLPVSPGFVFYPSSLLIGAGFALLSVLAFALVPLGRTRNTHVTSLFRATNLEVRAALVSLDPANCSNPLFLPQFLTENRFTLFRNCSRITFCSKTKADKLYMKTQLCIDLLFGYTNISSIQC